MDLSSLIPASWRTTLAGIIAGLSLLIEQGATLVDADPKSNPDIAVCVAAVAMMLGLVAARDKGVTSEQEGAK